jgi:hypothetical protein
MARREWVVRGKEHMKPEVVAQARRYYHHVLHGGTLRPEDVAFMVEALEEAANERKWEGRC